MNANVIGTGRCFQTTLLHSITSVSCLSGTSLYPDIRMSVQHFESVVVVNESIVVQMYIVFSRIV